MLMNCVASNLASPRAHTNTHTKANARTLRVERSTIFIQFEIYDLIIRSKYENSNALVNDWFAADLDLFRTVKTF